MRGNEMSENVMSTGHMVPLSRKITREEMQEWEELLWDQDSPVRFNYEGTLAYTDFHTEDEYGLHFEGETSTLSAAPLGSSFVVLKQFGLSIVKEQGRYYRALWYNGGDSDMSMMTLEKFLKRTGQEE
jgi:hypothetical protein